MTKEISNTDAKSLSEETETKDASEKETHAEGAKEIFVFGSNLAGMHSGGSALHAWDNHGAMWGNGVGLQGQSYAIPTLDENLEPLELADIYIFVRGLLLFAEVQETTTFNVVAIGCGIAGFTPIDIAPMFEGHTENIKLPKEFQKVLEDLETGALRLEDSEWLAPYSNDEELMEDEDVETPEIKEAV